PSFIFITGFLITNIYWARQDDVCSGGVSQRLLTRGLKLFAIFTLLNVALNLAFTGTPAGRHSETESLWDPLASIYLSGNGKPAAFQVLLPISYLLLLVAGILTFARLWKSLFYAGLFATLVAYAFFHGSGHFWKNVDMLFIGILGVITG